MLNNKLETIARELQRVDIKKNPLNQYIIGEDYVMYFHTNQNKDMKKVMELVSDIVDEHKDSIIIMTSNKSLYDEIDKSIKNQSNNIDTNIKDVELVESIHSTKLGTVDVKYGDIIWANMDNGMTKIVFCE